LVSGSYARKLIYTTALVAGLAPFVLIA
jgi:hypothetical protein